MKKIISLMLALVMALSLAACSTPSDDGNKTIIMGTSPDYPPFEYYTDAAMTQFGGIDVEVAKFIAEDMGMELQIQAMDFDNLVTSLAKGDFDVVIAACEWSEERAKSCDFSDPYYTDLPAVIVVKKDNVSKYTSEADINKAEIIIGSQKNTTKADAAAEKFDAAQHVNQAKVTTLITELKSDKIDLLVLDGAVGQEYVAQNSDLAILEGIVTWDEVEPYRVLVKKGDPNGLLEGINAAIAKLVANDSAELNKLIDIVANQDVYA